MIDINEQYKMLEQTRMLLNPKIITEKKRKIWEYFRGVPNVNLSNLEKRIRTNIILYRAPLLKIHGSNMVNWPTNNGDDIYIDQEFVIKKENVDIINQQLTHETIHSLCRTDDTKRFGHPADESNDYLKGIGEALTQVYTDDIENNILPSEVDYLYFVKNIMRVIRDTLGYTETANQFLNNDLSFENKFNEITNGKFDDFAFILNNIYKLDKAKHYTSITKNEEESLVFQKKLIIDFTKSFVKRVGNSDIDVYNRLKSDSFTHSFLNGINFYNNIYETK